MTKEDAIREIEDFYPPDSDYPDAREIGQNLLAEAKRRCNNWRNENEDVIFTLLSLCREENRKCEERIMRKTK